MKKLLLFALITVLISACMPQGGRIPQSPLLSTLERKSGLIAYIGADGNIYAAHIRNGSIDVISSGGKVLANLKTPHHDPSNLAFWGNDLYITDHGIGGVYRMSVGVSGLPLL